MKSLKAKLFVPFSLVALVIILVGAVISIRGFRRFYINSLIESGNRLVIYNAKVFPDSLLDYQAGDGIQPYCEFLDEYLKQRTTFIAPNGKVLGDSRVEYSALPYLDNHETRPEVLALKSEPVSYSIRYSKTLRTNMLYIAAPVYRNGEIYGTLRFAKPLDVIDQYLFHIKLFVAFFAVSVGVIILIIIAGFSSKIRNTISEIHQNAKSLEKGELQEKSFMGYSEETDGLYHLMQEAAKRIKALIDNLEEQKEEVKALLLSVSEGIIAVDQDFKVRLANNNAKEIFETNAKAGMDTNIPLIGFTHSHDLQKIAEESVRTRMNSESVMNFRNSKQEYFLKVVCTPISFKGRIGEPVLLITLVDMTEEKKLSNAKSYFAEAVSHELKTPLSIMKGYFETLQEKPDPKMAAQCYKKVGEGIIRLENIISDLIQISNLESGKVLSRPEKFNISIMVDEILEELSLIIKDKAVQVHVDAIQNIKSIPSLIYVLLYNLISNGIKYNNQNGKLDIRVALDSGFLNIVIKDSGIGISQDYREQVFERFFRIDKHRSRETGGTGLGLAIVKHAVNTLKGTVEVTDGICGGTGFSIQIPVLKI